jgi:hypothetical protein
LDTEEFEVFTKIYTDFVGGGDGPGPFILKQVEEGKPFAPFGD